MPPQTSAHLPRSETTRDGGFFGGKVGEKKAAPERTRAWQTATSSRAHRRLSVRSRLHQSPLDMPARGDLWLRSSRGLAHVLVGEQGDQKHQADIAERIKSALPAPASTRGSFESRLKAFLASARASRRCDSGSPSISLSQRCAWHQAAIAMASA